MSSLALSIKDLQAYRGDKKVLEIKEMRIKKGEHVAILGANGAGKSTLFQIINTLLPYHSGELALFGETVTAANCQRLRQRSSLVFQEALLLSNTVYENISLPLKFRRIAKRDMPALIEQAMNAFGCKHLSLRYAKNLSGGESQRVSLARALVYQPELLLLDEPFFSLDTATKTEILADLKQVARKMGMTVIMISHNFSDVLYFAERVIALEKGKIVQDDTPEKILRYPKTKEIATLVGMDNIFPCSVEKQGENILVKLPNEIFFPKKDLKELNATTCCLPGDAFNLLDEAFDRQSNTVVPLKGTVAHVMPGVGIHQITVLAQGLSFVACVPREKAVNYSAGSTIKIAFDPAQAHVF